MGIRGSFPGRSMKLTTHLHLALWSRRVDLYLHSPICIHGIVLNYVINYKDNFTFYLNHKGLKSNKFRLEASCNFSKIELNYLCLKYRQDSTVNSQLIVGVIAVTFPSLKAEMRWGRWKHNHQILGIQCLQQGA
jgi:hypothetical protein